MAIGVRVMTPYAVSVECESDDPDFSSLSCFALVLIRPGIFFYFTMCTFSQ